MPAHLDGKDLVITLDDFSQMAGEANADRFKARWRRSPATSAWSSPVSTPTGCRLRIVGTSPSGEDYDQTFPMTKDRAAAATP